MLIKPQGLRVDAWVQTEEYEPQNELLQLLQCLVSAFKQERLCENKGMWMLQLVLKLA